MRHGRIVTGPNFFGGVPAPLLQVFLVIGAALHRRQPRAVAALAAAGDPRAQADGHDVKPVRDLAAEAA